MLGHKYFISTKESMKKIDWSTDVRANRIETMVFIANFRHRSGAGDNTVDSHSNIKTFGQFLFDSCSTTKKKHVGPQWLLDILSSTYKAFLKEHQEIPLNEQTSLRRDIIDIMWKDITDNEISIGFYALALIQETKGAIDITLLGHEIKKRNPRYIDQYLGFNEEKILEVLKDEFIVQKIAEK